MEINETEQRQAILTLEEGEISLLKKILKSATDYEIRSLIYSQSKVEQEAKDTISLTLKLKNELIQKLDRTFYKGKINIWRSPLQYKENNELIASFDGYKDQVEHLVYDWSVKGLPTDQWTKTNIRNGTIEIRGKARKNQSAYSKDYKVITTYYYECI